MLEMLSSQEDSIGFFNDVLSGHSTPEINIELEEGEAQSLVEKTMLNLKSIKGQVVTVDGIRIEETDAWGLMRASNTTPSLVLRFEGDTVESLKTDPTDLQKFDNDIKTKYRTSILGKRWIKI